MLGMTVSGISRMVSRGKLQPAMKLPGLRGAFLFDPADVGAILVAQQLKKAS